MKTSAIFFLFIVVFFQASAQTPGLVPYRKDDLWGYADRRKNIVISPKYTSVLLFRERITGVVADSVTSYFIDSTGRKIGDTYSRTGEFSEGRCQVEKNGLQGYVDNSGKVVIPVKFKAAHPFREGLALVKETELWGVIDKTGKYVLQPEFDNMSEKFKDGFLYVEIKGRKFFIDHKGKELKLPPKMRMLSELSEGLAPVEITIYKTDTAFMRLSANDFVDSATVVAFVDKNCKVVLGPYEQEWKVTSGFKNGYSIMQGKYNLFYLLSKKGIISSGYTVMRTFSEGYAFCQSSTQILGTYNYLIDSAYKTIYLPAVIPADVGSFSEGLIAIKDYYIGKVGYYNTKGDLVISYKYTDAGEFKNGIAIVKSDEKTGCIDKNGTEFWE